MSSTYRISAGNPLSKAIVIPLGSVAKAHVSLTLWPSWVLAGQFSKSRLPPCTWPFIEVSTAPGPIYRSFDNTLAWTQGAIGHREFQAIAISANSIVSLHSLGA